MTKTLFTIQLRISQEIVDLPVIQNDTEGTLLDRLCDFDSVKNQFRKILNNKIKDSLNHILSKKNLEGELREKVQRFLKGETEKIKTGSKIEQIENKSQKLESRGEWAAKRHYQTHAPLKLKTSQSSHTPQIPVLHLSKDKKLLQIPDIKNNRPTNSHQKPQGNAKEIITAYETVYTKCKDPELKVMIKKTLQQLQKSQSTNFINRLKNPKVTPIESVQSITPYCQLAYPETYQESPVKQSFRACLEQSTSQNYNYDTAIATNPDIKRSNRLLPVYQVRNKSAQKYVNRSVDKQGERQRYLNPQVKGKQEYSLHQKSMTQVQSVRGTESKSRSRNKRYNYLSHDEICG